MSGFGIVDTFEDAARTVVDGAREYLVTVGVLLLVVLVLDVVQGLTIGPAFADMAADPSSPPDPMEVARLAGQGALLGLVNLVLTLAVGFVAVAVSWDLVEGREPTLSETWDRHGDRFLPFLGFLLLAVAIALGVMLVGMMLFFLIIPLLLVFPALVYLMLRWYVAPAAILVEGRGVRDAMDRSAQLTDGVKLSILGLVLLVGVVLVLLSIPLGLLTGLATGVPATDPTQAFEATSEPVSVVVNAVVNYVSQLVSLSLGAAAMIHVYRQLADEWSRATVHGPGADEEEVMFVPESEGADAAERDEADASEGNDSGYGGDGEGDVAWDEDADESGR